ncbi:MAG: universal stress protein [Proteobacteria bacterium]|nr:universal stress protein [Pseudomonadota bacterium]
MILNSWRSSFARESTVFHSIRIQCSGSCLRWINSKRKDAKIMTRETRSKIILAIDPFEEAFRPSRKALRELHYWAKKMSSRIEAVYVLEESDDQPDFGRLFTQAYDRLSGVVRNLNLGVPVSVRVIWDGGSEESGEGAREGARILTDYARETRADLILVSSHGRKWLSRMVLGSFAEKVLMKANVPVLFFGILPGSHESLHKVLFATDFSEASKTAFELFLRHVGPMEPEVVLLHVAEYPNLVTGMSLAGVGAYLPDTYWKVMKESLLSEGAAWVEIAKAKGLRARAVIEDGLGDVASAILRTARTERASLIGLSTVRSELQKIVMGSVSTRVFRTRAHSVWVCGPGVLEKHPVPPAPRPPLIGREMR